MTMPPSRTAQITVRYPYALIDLAWAGLVTPAVSHRLATGAARSFARELPDEGQLMFHAGHVPRVIEHLKLHGIHAVACVEQPYQPEDLPDLFDGAGVEVDPMLQHALRDNPCGQLLLDRVSSLPRLIANGLDALPRANIVVVARSKAEAFCLASRIERYTSRPSQVEADFRVRGRVLVTHPQVYDWCDDEAGKWNVAMFASAAAAISNRSLDRLVHAPRMRRYCIVPRYPRLRPYEQFCLEAVCGVPIYGLLDPAKDRAHVTALMVPVPCPAKSRPATTPWATKLAWYWHNSERNAYIANLARAVWHGDQAALRTLLGDPVAVQNRDWVALGRNSTTILVESIAHLQALARLLPEWCTRTAHSEADNIGSRAGGLIITELAAQHAPPRSGVIIRADGGPGWPLDRDHLPVRIPGRPRQVLLLDLCDAGHEAQRRDVASRQAAYERLGWDVLRPL